MLFDLFKNKRDYPPFWQEYLAHFKKKWRRDKPVEEIRFVVLDTETTGLTVKTDRILSIAAAGVKNGQLDMGDTFECYINQEVKSGKSVTIHGILSKDTKAGLGEAEAIGLFIDYCKDSVIVGQHIGYDMAMLNEVLKTLAGDKLRNKTVDTARMAVKVEYPFELYYVAKKPEDYSLDALCKRYNIPAQERHTAAGDVYITAILFMKLVARLKQRGYHSIGDLLNLR